MTSPRTPSGRTGPGQDIVTIRIPAGPEYIPILRTACGRLAPLLNYTPTEIADLRLAVDEACGLLLCNCIRRRPEPGQDQDDLVATFAIDGPSLRVVLEMEADVSVPPDGEEFGWAILNALVDDFVWRVRGRAVRVELRKLRAAGGPDCFGSRTIRRQRRS